MYYEWRLINWDVQKLIQTSRKIILELKKIINIYTHGTAEDTIFKDIYLKIKINLFLDKL